MKISNTKKFLFGILSLNLVLTLIGLNWGLPNRWCVDEQIANSLKLIASKSIFTVITNVHPQLYNFFLGILFLPYLLFRKITGYPLDVVVALAKISWMEMAHSFSNFATHFYLIARFSSVLLGVFSVYLLFRISKIIHNERVALFSALTLGVSMGFVQTNHFAKHTSLVVFLILLVLFFCLKALRERKYFYRYIYLASFSCGLAATAKLDGIISSLFIIGTFLYLLFQDDNKKNLKERMGIFSLRLIVSCGLLFAAGIIIGWPALLVNFDKYLQTREVQQGIFCGGFPAPTISSLIKVIKGIKDNFILLIHDFSLPLSFFIFWGIGNFFKNIKRYPYSLLIATMLLPYLFIASTYYTSFPEASTKFIIHAMILFCLFAGKVIDDFVSSSRRAYLLRRAFISGVFIFAIFYTFQADLFFCYRDTRYQSTAWILKNIPFNKTIEHFQEGENLFSTSEIPFKYDVIFWGRHSKDYIGKKSFYLSSRDDKEIAKYKAKLMKTGSEADFFIMAVGGRFVMIKPKEGTFLYRLYSGAEKKYKLVKSFDPKINFFFKPLPEWTAPKILIYEKVK